MWSLSLLFQKNIGIFDWLIVFIEEKKNRLWGFASDTDYIVGWLLFEMHSAFVKFFCPLYIFLQSFVCLSFLCLTRWIFFNHTKLQRYLYVWTGSCTSELKLKVNCKLRVNCRKRIGLVCQLLAKPAQILSHNSLSVYNSLSACTWSGPISIFL